MHFRTLARRRPSAPLVISVIALFVALGGVGYAATVLPANSVGTAQLKRHAVTNAKLGDGSVGNWKLRTGAVGRRKIANRAVGTGQIANGAVGTGQVNAKQIQLRVAGTCPTPGQAVTAVSQSGGVSCGKTTAAQVGASTKAPVTVDATKSTTQILTETLPSGSPYLLFATANATITGSTTGQWVRVSCTLSPGGTAASRTNTASVHVSADPESVTIPFAVPAPSTKSSATASLSCTETHASGAAPTVKVGASLNGLQTASNS